MGLNHDEKQISVQTEVQDFWYDPADVYPIVLSDEEMSQLKFTKEVMEDGNFRGTPHETRPCLKMEKKRKRGKTYERTTTCHHGRGTCGA